MAMSIYVGNLPWSATEEQVQSLFSDYGPLVSALDTATGGGRTLRVTEAKPRAPRPPRYEFGLIHLRPDVRIGALFLCPAQSGRRAGGSRARLRKRAFCGRRGRHSIRLQDICCNILSFWLTACCEVLYC